MKISELIKELEKVREEHGDIKCTRRDGWGHTSIIDADYYECEDVVEIW